MKRHFLSNREVREFRTILDSFGITTKSKSLEIEENDHTIVFDEKTPILVKFRDRWVPCLTVMAAKDFPSVFIDEGAQAKIKNGAKLFAAGVKKINGEMEKGYPCVIRTLEGRGIGSGIVESEVDEIKKKKKGAYLTVYELYLK